MEENLETDTTCRVPEVEADSGPLQTDESSEVQSGLVVDDAIPDVAESTSNDATDDNTHQSSEVNSQESPEMEEEDPKQQKTEANKVDNTPKGPTEPQEKIQVPLSKEEQTISSIYNIKWILFYESITPIVTQNENGPCPLIAIFNVLLLSRKIVLESRTTLITAQQITSRIAELIWDSIPTEFSENERTNYEQNISDAMSVFPNLMTGLDVNVRFYTVNSFECTKELTVFDLLRIPLYHGWLIDPQDSQVVNVIGNRSYNQIVEMIITQKSSADASEVQSALIAEQFLQSTASQLTCHGIVSLCEEMEPGSLAVLFRNNHFSTLHRRKTELFTLVTDLGFLNESNVVWETLSGIQGDSHFVDGLFLNSPLKTLATVEDGYEPVTEYDQQIALSLQQQENAGHLPGPSFDPAPHSHSSDYELAKRLQEEENNKVQTSSNRGRPKPHPSSARHPPRRPDTAPPSRRPVSAQPHSSENKCVIL